MAGMLLSMLLAAQVELKPRLDAGAEFRVELKSELEVRIVVVDREHEGTTSRERKIATLLEETFLQKVSEARDGRAVRFTLVCEKSVSERSGTGLEATGLVPTPRHGKTILINRDEAGHSVMIGADKAGSDASYLGRWEGFADLLPAGNRNVKDTWTKPWSALSFLMSNTLTPKLEGKDAEFTLTSIDGGNATITFKGTLKAKPAEKESVTLDITKGEFVFNVADGRPVSLNVEGKITLDRTIIEEEYRPEIDERVRIEVGSLNMESTKWTSSVTFANP